jgi:hypothetical protein
MKEKFNLIGDTFTHLTNGNKGYSVHGKESKYVEWVKEGGKCSFYIDSTLPYAWMDDTKEVPKYAWLLESKYITPQIVDHVKMFPEKYLETFDAIFTHNQELLQIDSKFKWCPAQGFWIQEPKIYEKSKMISMISSNKTMTEGQRIRLRWVEMFRDQIDIYGRGINEIALKEEGLCDYMFSVVIENGFYESYFTEKIMDCFATGTIPVYKGSPDIGKYFNKDGIIDLSEEFDVSEEIYNSKMDAIKDNLERVRQYEVLEDFIYLNYFGENA